MTKSTYMKYNFNGGELSPFLDGRVDYPKYNSGAKVLENFIPTVYGPITRRPGTLFTYNFGGVDVALYPFVFNQDQSYIVAFTSSGDINVFLNDALVWTYSGHGLGSDIFDLNYAQTGDLLYFTTKLGLFKLSRTDVADFNYGSVEFKNGPFKDDNTETDDEIGISATADSTTPYASGQTVTLTLPTSDRPPELIRFFYVPASNFDTWTPLSSEFDGSQKEYDLGDYIQYEGRVYEVTGNDGGPLPKQTGTRSPLHDREGEEVSDGKLLLTYRGDEWGYVRVISEIGGTITAEIEKALPVGSVPELATDPEITTSDWAYGAFDRPFVDADAGGVNGHPNAITFHEQRMVLGGTPSEPQRIYGSVINDIENFDRGTEDDESYAFTVASTKKNQIEWMASNVTLNIGTGGSEFIAASAGPAITPTDVSVSQITTYGSRSGVPPVVSNGFTVFAQAGGNKLRELRYNEETDRTFGRDLNKVAEHVANGNIQYLVSQDEPYQIIWVLIGGQLFGLTYETDEDVFAWHRHDVSDTVESIMVIPAGAQDDLYMIVNRDGNRLLERVSTYWKREDSQESAIYVDSAVTAQGEDLMEISGLSHLIGREIVIVADGAVDSVQTVESDTVELINGGNIIRAGLGYVSSYHSMRLEGGSQEGIGQGKAKHIKNMIFRCDGVGAGLEYGLGGLNAGTPEFEYSSFLDTRDVNDLMDTAPPLIFGDTEIQAMEGGWSKTYFVRIQHTLPTPCNLTAFICQLETNER